eukprot:XP_014790930.1 PREDICTED: major facilitator superfamily domain-containing protein 1-like [Octopus bimaculoides]
MSLEEADEKTSLIRSTEQDADEEEEEELSGCGATLPCNPRRNLHRYLILFIMCFLSFGSYFCYDNPAALQDHMLKDLSLQEYQFMSFYMWYSWPNVILCFFGGFLIDRLFGVRLGAIIFSSFVTVGQVIFALGAIYDKLWLMDMGRFIFGIGGESLAVAQNTYAVKWFKGKELNMVFGLQLSFSRIGSTVNMNIMGPLYNIFSRDNPGYKGLGYLLLIVGGATCLVSLSCALLLALFDKRADRILKIKAKAEEVVNIKDVKDFPLTMWLICIICVAYYVTVFPFIGLGLVFFENKFDFDASLAATVNSIVYIISAVASPVSGLIVDKTGKNIFWLSLGIFVTLICHALMGFTFLNPFVAMSLMGVAYSILASALWPLVAHIIPTHQLGTAYGVMQAIQNLGLALVSYACGLIVDSKGYLILEVFFLVCLCIALVAAVCLYLRDVAQGKSNSTTAPNNPVKSLAASVNRLKRAARFCLFFFVCSSTLYFVP